MATTGTTTNTGEDFQWGDVMNITGSLVKNAGVADLAGGQALVTENTSPDFNVLVAASEIWVENAAYADGNGEPKYFLIQNDGETLAIDSPDAQDRIDIIVAKAIPAAGTSIRGVDGGVYEVKKGTPAGSPVAPTPDPNTEIVGEVFVDSAAGNITNSDITDRRRQVLFLDAIAGSTTLANNEFFQGEDLGGTARNLIGVNTADDLIIGDSNLDLIRLQRPMTNTVQFGAKAKRTSAQSLSSATFTAINLDQEDFDRGTMHDNVTNNSRLTIPAEGDGIYFVSAVVIFNADSTGRRIARVAVDGTGLDDIRFDNNAVNGGQTTLAVSGFLSLTATQYVEIQGWQNSGGSLNVNSAVLSAFKIA